MLKGQSKRLLWLAFESKERHEQVQCQYGLDDFSVSESAIQNALASFAQYSLSK